MREVVEKYESGKFGMLEVIFHLPTFKSFTCYLPTRSLPTFKPVTFALKL
jgi:hypothetical protein